MDGCFFQSSTHYSVIYFSYRRETSIPVLKGQYLPTVLFGGPPAPTLRTVGVWAESLWSVMAQPMAVQTVLKDVSRSALSIRTLMILESEMRPTACHHRGQGKDRDCRQLPLLRAAESSLFCVRRNEAGTLPRREHEALARTPGYLQMPQGRSICRRGSPADLINTSLSRFASIWHRYRRSHSWEF